MTIEKTNIKKTIIPFNCFSTKSLFKSFPDLEKSGNACVANKDTGEKCYNTRLPNSLYCRDHITNKPYGLPE